MNCENFLIIFSNSFSVENSLQSGLSFKTILVPLSKPKLSALEIS